MISENLLLVSFNVTKNLERLKSAWSTPENEGEVLTSDILGGEIACLRYISGNPELIGLVEVRTPMGLHYSYTRNSLFVASDHWLNEIHGGRIVGTVSNPYFNCLHDIKPSGRRAGESLFLVSTGIDAILEIDPNNTDSILWDWFATENGYPWTKAGELRAIDRSKNHQSVEYSTPQHTTHINSILPLDENILLATLFHQGSLISISYHTKQAEVVFSGLSKPHGIRRLRGGGFLVCDTAANRVLLIDSAYKEVDSIALGFNWVQDARQLSDETIVIADADNHRLVCISKKREPAWEWHFGYHRRVAALLPITGRAFRDIFGGENEER